MLGIALALAASLCWGVGDFIGDGHEIFLFSETADIVLEPGEFLYRDETAPAAFSIFYDAYGNPVPAGVYYLALWADPYATAFFRRLASIGRLLLFDKPGTGLSDPVAGIPTVQQRVDDFLAVLDAAGRGARTASSSRAGNRRSRRLRPCSRRA